MDTPVHPTAHLLRVRLGMAAAMFLLAWLLQALPLVTLFERTLYDMRVRMVARGSASIDDIVVVEIDDRSLKAFEEDMGEWPRLRDIQAHLIECLSQARVIGMDVLYPEKSRVGDANLDGGGAWARVASASSNTVLAVLFTDDHSYRAPEVPPDFARMRITADLAARDALPENNHVMAPPPELLEAVHGVGDVRLKHDSDGAVRSYLAAQRYQGEVYPSLALAVAGRFAGVDMEDVRLEDGHLHVGRCRLPLAPDGSFLIQEHDELYPSIPASDVIVSHSEWKSGENPEYPPEYFRDKIVLVGVTSTGIRDDEMTPSSRRIPGTFIHAHAVDNLLTGVCFREAPSGLGVAMLALLALLPAVAHIERPRYLIVLGVLLLLLFLVSALGLAFTHLILPMAGPMLAIGLSYIGLETLGRARERSRRRHTETLDLAKQQFTDMLVHELKNTMAPIIMSLTMVGQGKGKSGGVDETFLRKEFPEIVSTCANKLMTQINALLDIRRLQEGRLQLKSVIRSPRELLERAEKEYEIPIRRAELRLEVVHQAADGTRIQVDPAVFDRILGNLIWNAVKYADQASTIRIGSRAASDGRLCIYVASKGKTIPDEVKGRLFSAFMTGHGSEQIRGRIPATGLGLTFCRLAVEAHHGEVDLRSPMSDGENGVEVRLLIPTRVHPSCNREGADAHL